MNTHDRMMLAYVYKREQLREVREAYLRGLLADARRLFVMLLALGALLLALAWLRGSL